eukprot:scaffold43545_cov343-Isochrysis_galbana.AAC.1
MLLASLLAMCKTAGASKCGSQTLSSSNIPSVQACTIIDGNLKVCYLSTLDARRVAPRKRPVGLS